MVQEPDSPESFFDVCPSCQGVGDANNCPTCQGLGVSLNLGETRLIISLPLYVDFASRLKVRLVKIFLIVLGLVFLVTGPYLLFVSTVTFVRRLFNL